MPRSERNERDLRPSRSCPCLYSILDERFRYASVAEDLALVQHSNRLLTRRLEEEQCLVREVSMASSRMSPVDTRRVSSLSTSLILIILFLRRDRKGR